MIYEIPVQGYFSVNCYFLIDDATGHGFLIDPGAEGEALARIIRERGWTIEKILLTHGHFDHTGGIEAIRREVDIPVFIHENGERYLTDPRLNLSHFCGPDVIVRNANFLRDGDTISTHGNAACTLLRGGTGGFRRRHDFQRRSGNRSVSGRKPDTADAKH